MSVKQPLDINTVLLAILVALSGWTLKTVHELSSTAAVLVARADRTDREVVELKAQAKAHADEIGNLRVKTAGRQ